jgi:pyruvate ferredoxin oxidoreductase gamma subunit
MFFPASYTNSHATSSTGVSPVQAQAEACGYQNSRTGWKGCATTSGEQKNLPQEKTGDGRMIEIRIHGRGGQGNVAAAELLANAAFRDGKYAQAFPSFGAERVGAPVQAFVRIDDKKIRTREEVREPDYLIIQDQYLIDTVPVLDGLKEGGLVLVNAEKKPEELRIKTTARVETIPATEIAMEIVGRPIPNAIMIGAFCSITGLVSLDAVQEAIMEKFPGKVGENNVAALERAHEIIQKRKG